MMVWDGGFDGVVLDIAQGSLWCRQSRCMRDAEPHLLASTILEAQQMFALRTEVWLVDFLHPIRRA